MDEVEFDFAKFCRGTSAGVGNAENFDFDEFCRDDGEHQPPSPGILAKDVKIVCSKIRGLLMNFVRTLPKTMSGECDDAVMGHLQWIDQRLNKLIDKLQHRQV